jgi:hypothetical protein
MKPLIIAGIDIGLSGGISIGPIGFTPTTLSMPTIQIQTKPAIKVLQRDSSGHKQFYKSGPQAGEPKYIIKTPAKYSTELDILAIYHHLLPVDIVVIESQGTSVGNSSRSTRTTAFNAGQLHACALLANCRIYYVAPHKWKSDFNLPADKLPTIELAEALSHQSFRTSRGALLDGQADAYMIRQHFIQFTLPTLDLQ